MQFQLTNEFLEILKEDIARFDRDTVSAKVGELYPADIAEILDEVNLQEAQFIFKLLEDELGSEVLMELDEDVRERFLASLSDYEIAEYVDQLDTDDAADLIAELPEDRQEEVLSHVDDSEQASDIADLLAYDEDSAGGIMAKELIKVNINWPVVQCVREMRKQAEDVDQVFTVYVVDDNGMLMGIVSLKKMLLSSTRALIKDIYKDSILSVDANMKAEDVAKFMEKYDLVVVPVVDEQKRLLGRITVDDVMDVVREETSKDYQMLSGISENIETTDNVWVISRARLPWLLVAMFGGIIGSMVISNYEDELQVNPQMAFFIPLVVAMGGNVGIQSSALIVQGLANNTLSKDSMIKRILKELMVGLLNGVACAAVLLVYSMVFHYPLALSLTIGASLLTVILFAAAFGTFIPLTLHRMKIDPALATGPFITTTNDIIGLFFYFLIARVMYGMTFL
ncbi:MAG: magnesium transporter [Flavobacteriales bacterium]|nr:magnesium transporter [Flavobacteriales bacterium]